MKLLFATDLHGHARAYERLAELALDEKVAAVLLGGDLFVYSRLAAPQLVEADGPFRAFLEGLRRSSIAVLAIHGNMDRPAAVSRLHDFQQKGLLRVLELQPFRFACPGDRDDSVDLVGYPYVPPTPLRLKDYDRRDLATDTYAGSSPALVAGRDPLGELEERTADYLNSLPSIEEDLARIPGTEFPFILIAHSPPWGGTLDQTNSGIHAGSQALRNWFEVRQPVLALHGHIHEAPDISGRWAERIHSTIAVNPGASTDDSLQAVLIDTSTRPYRLWHSARGPLDASE